MPHTVTHTVLPHRLRNGDKFVNGRHFGTVDSIEVKTKFAYVNVIGGHRPIRIDLNEEVKIERVEPTQAEKDAELKMYALESLTKSLHKFTDGDPVNAALQTIVQKRDEAVDRYPNTVGREVLDYSTLNGLLDLQAEVKPWFAVRDIQDRILTNERWADVETDVLTAVALAIRDRRRHTYNRNPLSRSTSVLSNLLEDLEAYAWTQFEDKLGWSGISGKMLEAEIARVDAIIEGWER